MKGILPHDTLLHNFYQKGAPCYIIFTAKGHPVKRHIPSSQVWEYPPPSSRDIEVVLKEFSEALFVTRIYLPNYLNEVTDVEG